MCYNHGDCVYINHVVQTSALGAANNVKGEKEQKTSTHAPDS